MSAEERIFGRRAVLEALRSSRRRIHKIILGRDLRGGILREIADEAERQGIQEADRKRLDAIVGTEHHQGVIALVSPLEKEGLSTLLFKARERREDPFLVVIDGLTDPRNLGAVIRSAECAGVHGVILPARGSAPTDRATSKSSAGAVEYLPLCHVGNLGQAILQLKHEGVRVVAADAAVTATNLYTANLTGGIALVIGSEEKGVSRLVRDRCDLLVRIPMKGKIASLNASAAAAILLYEIVRRRSRL